MFTDFRALQPRKVEARISVNSSVPLGNRASVRLSQSAKALVPMLTTLSGSSMAFRLVQPAKA